FARGHLQIPHFQSFEFAPNAYCCKHPGFFRRFRDDEIHYLNIFNVDTCGDQVLPALTRLTGLRALRLSDTDVTDNGVQFLDALSNLTELDVSRTEITGKSISKLKQLKAFTVLKMSMDKGGSQVVSALVGTKKIRMLGLNGTELTDADLAK